MIALVLASGCGGSDSAAEVTTVTDTVTVTAVQGDAPSSGNCGVEVAAFLGELQELSSRLSVGLTYVDYVEGIGDIAVARDRIPRDTLSPECQSAVKPALAALILYQRVQRYWASCLNTDSCSDPRGQKNRSSIWREAAVLLEEADSLVDGATE